MKTLLFLFLFFLAIIGFLTIFRVRFVENSMCITPRDAFINLIKTEVYKAKVRGFEKKETDRGEDITREERENLERLLNEKIQEKMRKSSQPSK